MFIRISFTLVIALFCFSFYSLKNISSNDLMEDYDLLIAELREKHQGLDQYEEPKIVDYKIDSLRNLLSESMSTVEFYKIIRAVINLTNEGHTYANLPEFRKKILGLSKSFFPMSVDFCNKQMVIRQHYGEENSELESGMRILSINGMSTNLIMDQLKPYVPTDGFNETSKYEFLSSIQFASLYRIVFGAMSEFKITVQNLGEEPITIGIPAVRYTSYKSENAKLQSKDFQFIEFDFEILNDSIAYWSVPSLGDDDLDYEEYYKEYFAKIDSANIQHVILDLQYNGGGTEGNQNLLYHYFDEKVFQLYSSVTMPLASYENRKDDEQNLFDKWTVEGKTAYRGELTTKSNYFSQLGYEMPTDSRIYRNKLYVLTSGHTFSGAAELSSMFKMNNRAIFVGEETGGAYEGNVSGYSDTFLLPNSKIEVQIPIVHYKIDVNPETKGKGVMPDYFVPQSWEDYLDEGNSKLEYVLKKVINTKTDEISS